MANIIDADIEYNITMSDNELKEIQRGLKKLSKLDRDLESLKLKAGNVRHRELAGIAKKLGMERSRTRNTEPYFESTLLPDSPPIPIPDHSAALGKGLTIQIIKQLEAHAFLLREMLMDKQEVLNKKRNDIDHKINYEK